MDSITCRNGEEITIPNCTFISPDIDIKFALWNTSPDETGDSYHAGDKVKDLSTIDKDIVTLYAIWIDRNALTIRLNDK